LLIICDKNACILYVGNLYLGAQVDFSIFKKELASFNYNQIQVWVDLGFIGIQKVLTNGIVQIGYKRNKNTELNDEQKAVNKQIAKQRIVVEHAIGGLKRYYILRNEIRFKKPHLNHKMEDAVETCAELWNFKRSFYEKCAQK